MAPLIVSRAHDGEHVSVEHTQSGKLSFSNRFMVYMWTGVNYAKTLRVDANFFENGVKNFRFQTNKVARRQGVKCSRSPRNTQLSSFLCARQSIAQIAQNQKTFKTFSY